MFTWKKENRRSKVLDQDQLCSLSFGCFFFVCIFWLKKRGTQSSLSEPVVLQLILPALPIPSKRKKIPTTHPQGWSLELNSASVALWSLQHCFCVSTAFGYGFMECTAGGEEGFRLPNYIACYNDHPYPISV